MSGSEPKIAWFCFTIEIEGTRVGRLSIVLVASCLLACASARAQTAQDARYRGWDTLELANHFIRVQVAPQIGGRVIPFQRGGFEFFFVNEELAGKSPTPTGLGPDGEWLNYGGEKLWREIGYTGLSSFSRVDRIPRVARGITEVFHHVEDRPNSIQPADRHWVGFGRGSCRTAERNRRRCSE